MARDYDYLFKLLIIGDSGKARAGTRDGKRASANKLGTTCTIKVILVRVCLRYNLLLPVLFVW